MPGRVFSASRPWFSQGKDLFPLAEKIQEARLSPAYSITRITVFLMASFLPDDAQI